MEFECLCSTLRVIYFTYVGPVVEKLWLKIAVIRWNYEDGSRNLPELIQDAAEVTIPLLIIPRLIVGSGSLEKSTVHMYCT